MCESDISEQTVPPTRLIEGIDAQPIEVPLAGEIVDIPVLRHWDHIY